MDSPRTKKVFLGLASQQHFKGGGGYGGITVSEPAFNNGWSDPPLVCFHESAAGAKPSAKAEHIVRKRGGKIRCDTEKVTQGKPRWKR